MPLKHQSFLTSTNHYTCTNLRQLPLITVGILKLNLQKLLKAKFNIPIFFNYHYSVQQTTDAVLPSVTLCDTNNLRCNEQSNEVARYVPVNYLTDHTLLLFTTTFYDPLCGTIQVSRYQKDKPFWILLKQT